MENLYCTQVQPVKLDLDEDDDLEVTIVIYNIYLIIKQPHIFINLTFV